MLLKGTSTPQLLLAGVCGSALVAADSLKSIKHVVIFMQENRAFDHYFGTMPGVRGFADPNVQVNPDGHNTFEQLVNSTLTNRTDVSYLTPWYANYLGGNWSEATPCVLNGGDNSWQAVHRAYDGGLNDEWAQTNTPYSWAHFKRQDIPTHFDVAEGWTVGDMYQAALIAATDPNRVMWMSGTVNTPGTPNNPDGTGNMILDNNASPGCDIKPNVNCYPFTWKTFPEYLQDAGVTWQLYQDPDNFEDNMLAYFEQYQKAGKDSPLTKRGNSYIGLQRFYDDAREGKLPQVSIIVGPAELSEHAPYLPSDGAWLIKQVVDAVTHGKNYKETALFISYDEGGGYGDHVVPYHSPEGTPGEWINDPYKLFGETPIGPGIRLPFFIISPWTRGGVVFSEHADHISQLLFLEKWLATQGHSVHSKEITQWRRQHMSDLVSAFDFSSPDYSLPSIVQPPAPLVDNSIPPPIDTTLGNLSGNYVGAADCEAKFGSMVLPVPYGEANEKADVAALVEDGFKKVRGALTEGRYLVFESRGFALTNSGGKVTSSRATAKHNSIQQRWVLHQQGEGDSDVFTIQSAKDGSYVSKGWKLSKSSKSAITVTIQDQGNGKGYTLKTGSQPLSIDSWGRISAGKGSGFSIFSVTYKK
ncbi:putative non-hemolytic phospholipase C precursor [Rhizodiscina lignyota]|uniref:Non-hemolytic phospholipase C n=1 Tax=Rhizodiscina lignyota TaxID=1504668 RepID=A0A9P4IK90_9PEZI|nr:putative non-hemolytic phospholipase C precursor [Rhizodiscina lignyota]